MLQESVQILWNHAVGADCYRLGLAAWPDFSRAEPGQFVMLRFPGQAEPLLSRPFSIHRLIQVAPVTEGLEILYKVVGPFTHRLSEQRQAAEILMLGPLGKGFQIPVNGQRFYLVAGGIGVAPLLFLATYLHAKGVDLSDSTVFLGAKSKNNLLCQPDFDRLGVHVHVSTDDGSAGEQCVVTRSLEHALRHGRADMVFACGPTAMLACTIDLVQEHGIPCQVSIETLMACGMGACLGCAVEMRATGKRYLHACRDGPVFDGRRVSLKRN